MPRSPNDATRFTATAPHVSTKPMIGAASASNSSAQGSRIDFGNPSAGETPQQRIARLRAAAASVRLSKEDTFDKVVRIGRRWADRAHRFTALGLLGVTAISAVVATAGITDMVLHNRRRRKEFYAEQEAQRAADVDKAQHAQGLGFATEDQLLLLNQERARMEAAEAKRNRPGVFKRASNYLFNGLSKEEQKGGRLANPSSATSSVSELVAEANNDGQSGKEENTGVLAAVTATVESNRRQAERSESIVRPDGGPLDRHAQLIVDATIDEGRSWRRWLSGR